MGKYNYHNAMRIIMTRHFSCGQEYGGVNRHNKKTFSVNGLVYTLTSSSLVREDEVHKESPGLSIN